MKNIKIGNTVYENVEYISCDCSEQEGVKRRFIDEDDALDTSDATAVASDIAKDKTAYANGVKLTGTFEGGDQPTLFPPTITGGVNTISWVTNTANGNFSITTVATIDGVTVTSPLTITSEMNGKILIVTSSAENFGSATNQITLSYMNTTSSLLSISNGYTNRPYYYLGCMANNTTDITYNNSWNNAGIYKISNDRADTGTSGTGSKTMSFNIVIRNTISGNTIPFAMFVFTQEGSNVNVINNDWTVEWTINKNGNLLKSGTKYGNEGMSINPSTDGILNAGDIITFIANVTGTF